MQTTANTNNQGIVHLAQFAGGRPFCGARRAHISVPVSEASEWPRICVKCQKRIAPKAAAQALPSACSWCREAARKRGDLPANLKRHYDECPSNPERTNG